MAQISNSFATFNSSRVREQLLDNIWNVSVSETPTLALIGKEKVNGPMVEWLNDSFRAGASNKVEAGNLSAPVARGDVVRYNNRTQITEDVLSITGTQQVAEKAGGKDEVSYQETKRSEERRGGKDFRYRLWPDH